MNKKQAIWITCALGFFGLFSPAWAATIYAVQSNGEIRSFAGAASMQAAGSFANGTLVGTIAGYGAYQGFTQTPDGIIYGVDGAGAVHSWTTPAAWLANDAPTVMSMGKYGGSGDGNGGVHGISYDANTGGFYVVYEGDGSNGLDGDVGEYATLNDFIRNQNVSIAAASYGGNIMNMNVPDSDSPDGAYYYQISGGGALEGFTTLASYAATPNNRVYSSGVDNFLDVGAAFAVMEDFTLLLPPLDLIASPTNGKVRLEWSEGTGAATYNVYRSAVRGSYGAPLQIGVTDLFFEDAAVSEYDRYYYAVSSVNNGSESALSEEEFVVAPGSYEAEGLNILFVFIDDIGWGDLSCYGNTATTKSGGAVTPHLDKLASQGIRFTDGYVGAPICSPSRVCVLTGIESQRYAIYSFLSSKTENDNRNMNDWLDPYTVAAPRLFRDAGYVTGQFGKWHMGGGRDVNHAPFPQAYGFQESVVAFEGMGDRVMPIGHGLSSANADVPGDITWAEWYESADLHTDAAIDFIARAVESNKNFYVHVPYNDTHSPYNTDPGKECDFDHITGNTTAQLFLSELNELDKEIGRLVQAIDDLGAGGNTLVVIVGDNGAPDDAVNAILNRNGGLRGGKGSLWEGGFREPFFIRCPGLVPAGIVNESTAVSTLDLLPTYAALARIELPNAPFAGEDMSDVFTGSTRARQKPLFWEYASVSGAPTTSPKLAMRNGNYKLLINPDGSNAQFYDLSVDKEESNNLIGDAGLQSEISDMQVQLTAWYHEVVLGEVGEPVSVTNAAVSPGVVIFDDYTVTGGNVPNPGFGANDGVNYEFASRVSGMAATNLTGYWYNTGSRPATDFSITGNRLSAIPDNANARFEFSANGSSGFDFGSWLAGNTYELSVQMDVDVVGATYAQRMSLSLADASGLAIQEIDLGIQVGTDGAGGLGVFKRMDAGSNSGGSDVNTMVASGYAIGTPLDLKIVVQDFNSNTTDYASSYEIFVNGASVDSGSFRFNGSSSARYLIFDTAAHEGYVYYDEVKLEVTQVNGGSITYLYEPKVAFSSIGPDRIHWNAQPASVYEPQSSTNLIDWISHGLVTNEFGTIQWLEPTGDQGAARFFRLK